ncbi:MAG: hypothetical protein ACR2ID_10965 [Chthoniobacterales bacterium]
MKTWLTLLCCSALFLSAARTVGAQEPTAAPAVDEAKYGVYPIAWKEIITRWLDKQLIDPASAQIEWTSEPKPIEIKGRDGELFFGYVVEFKVNSRNKFGTYTGKQSRRVYLRNGNVAAGGRVKS